LILVISFTILLAVEVRRKMIPLDARSVFGYTDGRTSQAYALSFTFDFPTALVPVVKGGWYRDEPKKENGRTG
jgi:hypothetical protein